METTQLKPCKKIKFTILKVFEYKKTFNESADPECGICYKRISNKLFVCAKPCSKTFHQDCLEKMIDHIEDNTTDEKTDPDYRCCYCRRNFDIRDYDLTLFKQKLAYLSGQGYKVDEAIIQSEFNTVTLDAESDAYFEYNVYLPLDIAYFKLPKLGKHAEFKKKNKRLHQHLYKHNGRR